MAGHSHAKNIMRHKGAMDAKRGKLFSKLSRYIIIAAKSGGGDPTIHPSAMGSLARASGKSAAGAVNGPPIGKAHGSAAAFTEGGA